MQIAQGLGQGAVLILPAEFLHIAEDVQFPAAGLVGIKDGVRGGDAGPEVSGQMHQFDALDEFAGFLNVGGVARSEHLGLGGTTDDLDVGIRRQLIDTRWADSLAMSSRVLSVSRTPMLMELSTISTASTSSLPETLKADHNGRASAMASKANTATRASNSSNSWKRKRRLVCSMPVSRNFMAAQATVR